MLSKLTVTWFFLSCWLDTSLWETEGLQLGIGHSAPVLAVLLTAQKPLPFSVLSSPVGLNS
jgi:hypothetical protein